MAYDYDEARKIARGAISTIGAYYLHWSKTLLFSRSRTAALSRERHDLLVENIHSHLRSLQKVRSHQKLLRQIERELHVDPNDLNKGYNHFVRERSDSITLIGAGNMGSALIRSWTSLGLSADNLIIVDPKPSAEAREISYTKKIRLLSSIDQLDASSVFVLAVKPQDSNSLLPELKRFTRNRSLIISIMAGKTLKGIQAHFSSSVGVVRAMPNLPSTIGRGITAAIANNSVTTEQRELTSALLNATGGLVWIPEESYMDAVTAVSGSGPAYVFLLAECLAAAAGAAGLPLDLAKRLAKDTISGAGELLDQSIQDPELLRRNVTSPGGTTAAALEVLMGPHGFKPLLTEAIAAATRRSRELAG